MGVLKNDVGRPSNKTIMIRKILKVTLLIILMVMVFVGGYLLKDYQNKNSKTETIKTEELDISSKEILDLYEPFTFYMHEASDEELYFKDKVTPDDLSIEYKNRLAFAKYVNETSLDDLYDGTEVIDEQYNVEVSYLKSSKLEKYYKKLFGKESKYVAKTFDAYNIRTLSMDYDEKKDIYYETPEGGDYTVYRYGHELFRAVKSGDKIYLYEYVVVYNEDYMKDIVGVYANLEDANNFENAIRQINGYGGHDTLMKFNEDNYSDDLSDYKDKASKYKLTFEKEDNNYVFKQIEKIK